MHPFLFHFAVLSSESPWSLSAWIVASVVLLLVGFGLNLFGLAGNWVMFATSVVHYFLVDRDMRVGYQPGLILLLFLLALTGEGLEALSGIVGTGKAGGSRRAMVLSMLGGMIGSIFGFGIGNVFVPLLGGIVGIFVIGGVGSFAGAMLGEMWKGSSRSKTLEVGQGAFWGRILGTLAKTLIGSLMLVLALGGMLV